MAAAFLALFSLAPAFAELWKLEPGVTTRGKKPESWVVDLRHQTPATAAAASVALTMPGFPSVAWTSVPFYLGVNCVLFESEQQWLNGFLTTPYCPAKVS